MLGGSGVAGREGGGVSRWVSGIFAGISISSGCAGLYLHEVGFIFGVFIFGFFSALAAGVADL
jgi:hypothetical protein